MLWEGSSIAVRMIQPSQDPEHQRSNDRALSARQTWPPASSPTAVRGGGD